MTKSNLVDFKYHINKALDNIIETNDVRILFAVESGSRAWGFASPNSDFDVRYIYARKSHNYLTFKSKKDTIEQLVSYDMMPENPLDIVGWDIRKAIELCLKSNIGLQEWLSSPFMYRKDNEFMDRFSLLARAAYNPVVAQFHYQNITAKKYSLLQYNTIGSIKTYLYAIRCAIAARWARISKEPPPMVLADLCKENLIVTPDLCEAIDKIVSYKTITGEKGLIERSSIIDNYIECAIRDKPTKSHQINISDDLWDLADNIFKQATYEGIGRW